MKNFFTSLMIGLLFGSASFAQNHSTGFVPSSNNPTWVSSPKQVQFKDVKNGVLITKESGQYSISIHFADATNDIITKFLLTKPLDGDDTNLCYGTFTNENYRPEFAICTLSEMSKTSCNNVDLKACRADQSIQASQFHVLDLSSLDNKQSPQGLLNSAIVNENQYKNPVKSFHNTAQPEQNTTTAFRAQS